MSSTYISTVFIFCVALNPFSAAENNAHEEISREEFEQMKNGMKMLLEKVQIQETIFKTHYLIYNETLHKVSLTITILKIYYLYLTTFLQLSI